MEQRDPSPSRSLVAKLIANQQLAIAGLSSSMIVAHVFLRFAAGWDQLQANLPLLLTLALGGAPLVWGLLVKLAQRNFGSDLLAGISIVTSVLLGEYLAGALVVLMLSGGEALESFAVRSASSVLRALAKRMPSVAHRKDGTSVSDVPLAEIQIGDMVLVLPHESCPVDGTVAEGHGVMDESYLTGEPYLIAKTPGSTVLSGAINGESALTIRADRRAADSRYASIMKVMEASQQNRPRIRRMGDQLGAIYTPLAVSLALAAWAVSGDPLRFLAVMVVATPCPLLIAIPVAIIGSISLAARRAIIVRDPAVLEQIDRCKTIIFDKTGTLTYGKPQLVEQVCAPELDPDEILSLVASIETYSKHPLAGAIVAAAQGKVSLREASQVSERPGDGLRGVVADKAIRITSRQLLLRDGVAEADWMPSQTLGLECLVLVNGKLAATYRFSDAPRQDSALFVKHLGRRHGVKKVILLSGDRQAEVNHLAKQVGITECYGNQSPEEKLEFVRRENSLGSTAFVGDGINDAPALMAANVGIAFGQNSDVTSEAAGAVILDSTLGKVDEFIHIGHRMRRIALQSAVGGMALSLLGMLLAFAGYLPPVVGAVVQEAIDVVAVLNALRAAWTPRSLADF
ncbi:MAG: cadmium-translocating P-type ATPase [Planctomycetales bacterium]|nr:cadmium-translocating P-type ATPase [Planctomycetales bacterium]